MYLLTLPGDLDILLGVQNQNVAPDTPADINADRLMDAEGLGRRVADFNAVTPPTVAILAVGKPAAARRSSVG